MSGPLLQAAMTPLGFKPPRKWGFNYLLTQQGVTGSAQNTPIVFPFDDGVNAVMRSETVAVKGRQGVSFVSTRHGDGLQNLNEGSDGPSVTYPSESYISAFPGPYRELTFVLWAVMETGPTGSGFKCAFDATSDNTTAWR